MKNELEGIKIMKIGTPSKAQIKKNRAEEKALRETKPTAKVRTLTTKKLSKKDASKINRNSRF